MDHSASLGRPVLHVGSRHGRRRLVAAAALAFLAGTTLATPVLADDDQQGDAPDAAGPAVARVSLVQGAVSIKRGDSSDDVEATANAPLLAADYLSTGDDGRAEVQYDGVSLLRLDANTQVRFASLDPDKREAQLAEGTVEIRQLEGDDGRPQLDTPSISLQPLETGSYRVTVTPDGSTLVSVRSGRIAVVTPAGTNEVDAGQSIVAQGSADDPNVQSTDAVPTDDFDGFNGSRDRLELRALRQANFDPQTDGDELDAYGNWVDVPSYGRVWHPTEDVDWAPYHDGRWVWEDAYGWTWVAAEPWGWAPYHYGRWFYNAGYGGWLWTPPAYGPAYAYAPAPEPVFWRPALVSFFGFGFGGGGGVSLSIGFGNVGWVPLAPNEVYHPWYGAGNGWNGYGGYGHNGPAYSTTNITNVTNVTNVTNINYGNITRNYANAAAPGAIATVDTRRFLEGNYRPTTVSVTTLRTANVGAFRGPLPLAPTRQNLTFTNRPVPATAFRPAPTRTAFAGNAPTTNRYRFSDQRTEITNNLQSHNLPVRPEAFTQASVIPSAPTTGARYPSGNRAPGGGSGTGYRNPETGGNGGERNADTGTGYRSGTGGTPPTGNVVPPRGAAPTGSGDSPWNRFPGHGTNGTNGATPTETTPQTTAPRTRYPAGGDDRSSDGSTPTYRTPSTATGSYRTPSTTTGGYRTPATSTSTGTYRTPATSTSTGTYRAPATTSGGSYRAPAGGGYGSRPPATGTTGSTYYRAPGTGVYRKPVHPTTTVRKPPQASTSTTTPPAAAHPN